MISKRVLMTDSDKIVAVALFTQADFERWGSQLRTVFLADGSGLFEDLLLAIDQADRRRSAGDGAD
jgi:hypothetical protein